MPKSPIPLAVAELVARMIDESGRTQAAIAAETGFPKPNVLSMIRHGQTRLPLDRAPAFARACGRDPVHLLRTALAEYHPAVHRVLVDAFGEPLTSLEAQLVAVYRAIAPDGDLPIDAILRDDLLAVLEGGDPEPEDPVLALIRTRRAGETPR